MLVSSSLGHLENNVGKRSSLSNLPMNTSSGSIATGQIDLEVSDLSVEVVLVLVPVVSTITVWVGVNDSNSSEIRRGNDCRDIVSISDKLSEVVLNDRR